MIVSLRQLEAFRAVATELHFARAAGRLDLAQPTVSKELQRLERAWGVELFHRSSGGTVLTAEGAELLPYADRALAALTDLETAAATVRRRRDLQVRVAISPSVVNRVMPDLLRRLETVHPGLTVTAVEVETGEVARAVERGDAEVGLGHLLGEVRGGRVRTLRRDELFLLLSDDLAQGLVGDDIASVDLATLGDLPLLLWPREQHPAYYDALLEVCRTRGLDPAVLLGTPRISGSRSYFLLDGRAFALVPRDFALTETPGLRALPLRRRARLPLDVAWTELPSPAARHVLEEVSRLRSRDRAPR